MSKTWNFSSHPVLPPSASLFHHVTGLGHVLLHLCPVTAAPRGTAGASTGRAEVCVPLCHETGPWTLYYESLHMYPNFPHTWANVILNNKFKIPWQLRERDLEKRKIFFQLFHQRPAFLSCSAPYQFLGFPDDASGKEPTQQCRIYKRHGFDPWVGKIPWRRDDNPLQYSCLENFMDRGAWQPTAHRVAKSQTQLKQFSMHSTWIHGIVWKIDF